MKKDYSIVCPICMTAPIKKKRYYRRIALKGKFGYREQCMTCKHLIKK